jgi:hypothetical protein
MSIQINISKNGEYLDASIVDVEEGVLLKELVRRDLITVEQTVNTVIQKYYRGEL